MINKLSQYLYCQRIFVIAGIAHLTLQPAFNRTKDAKAGVNLLHQYCWDKKYVVLYPNEREADLGTIQEELRPSTCTKIQNAFRGYSNTQRCCAATSGLLCSPLLCLGAILSACVWGSRKACTCCSTSLCCLADHHYRKMLEQQHPFFLMALVLLSARDESLLPRQRGISLIQSMQKSVPIPPFSEEDNSKHTSDSCFSSPSLQVQELKFPHSPTSSEGSQSPQLPPHPHPHSYKTFGYRDR